MSDKDKDQLSQHEIDALLSGGGALPQPAGKGAPAAPPAATPDAAAANGAAEGAFVGQADIDALLGHIAGGGSAAQAASATATAAAPAIGAELQGAVPSTLSVAIEPLSAAKVDLLKDVSVKVRVELGRGKMYLRDIIRLTHGSVVELEKLAGDPLDIYVNERLIAKGEVLVLNENFCVRITEIFSPEEVLRLKN